VLFAVLYTNLTASIHVLANISHMLPKQRSLCTDCKLAQQYTTRGQPLTSPEVTYGCVQ